MTLHPDSFVDSHVHFWDRSQGFFVGPSDKQRKAFGTDGNTAPQRDYSPADYRADARAIDIPKAVWITATLAPQNVTHEIAWVSKLAEGEPMIAGIVGSVDPGLSPRERKAELAAQSAFDLFRGVRVLTGLDYGTSAADEYIRMLADVDARYDLVAHHESMADAARLAERHPDVPFVLEHCGWPMQPRDPDYVAAWREGISALASVGTVHCKISGLAMTLCTFDLEAQRPFIEHCLESFGEDRCMVGSNFPVDAAHGRFDELIGLYRSATEGLGIAAQRKLFTENAERFYNI